jgi:hypothetical protein
LGDREGCRGQKHNTNQQGTGRKTALRAHLITPKISIRQRDEWRNRQLGIHGILHEGRELAKQESLEIYSRVHSGVWPSP